MLRALTAAIMAMALLVSCSKSESKKFPVSPQINIKAIDGRCLDLQSAVQQMDNPGFNFPGYVYTRNFEIVSSKVRTEYADSLMAKSFRAENTNFRGLPDLRGARQQSCEKIMLSEFGGRTVTYNITSYSKNHLELDLDKEALEESLSEMSVHHKKQLSKTPLIKKFIVTFVSPTEMELTSIYNAIPSECYNSTNLSLREEAVYGWAESSAKIASKARINPAYWGKLGQLAGTIGPEEVPQTADTMDLTAGSPTVAGLQAYAHPHCF